MTVWMSEFCRRMREKDCDLVVVAEVGEVRMMAGLVVVLE